MCVNSCRFSSLLFTFTESTPAPMLPTKSEAVQTDGRTDKQSEIHLLETLTFAELQNSDPDIVCLK